MMAFEGNEASRSPSMDQGAPEKEGHKNDDTPNTL